MAGNEETIIRVSADEIVRRVAELRAHEQVDERLREFLFTNNVGVDGLPGTGNPITD